MVLVKTSIREAPNLNSTAVCLMAFTIDVKFKKRIFDDRSN